MIGSICKIEALNYHWLVLVLDYPCNKLDYANTPQLLSNKLGLQTHCNISITRYSFCAMHRNEKRKSSLTCLSCFHVIHTWLIVHSENYIHTHTHTHTLRARLNKHFTESFRSFRKVTRAPNRRPLMVIESIVTKLQEVAVEILFFNGRFWTNLIKMS